MSDDMTDDQIADVIAAMDGQWQGKPVSCQCPGEPHGGKGCTNLATVVVERHLPGECVGPEANAAGNRVELLCLKCARDLWESAQRAVARWRNAAAQAGTQPLCATCGAPMSRPSDLVRSVQRYDGGVR